MADSKTILEVLGKYQEFYGRDLSPEVQAIYVEHLSDMPDHLFKRTAVQLMREFQPTSTVPFPLVRDFLVAAGLDEETMAVNAVSLVRKRMESVGQYDSVSFDDLALHSVIDRYGGWVEMVNNNTDKWWSLHERNFIQAYKAARRAGTKGPERLLGLHEATNRNNGYDAQKISSMRVDPRICGFEPVKQVGQETRRIEKQ